ncbi:MAG: tyrosine-type recombinase/integrase [Cyclobacteriaceae bacterium]|nr:tyrosine-type recombinase/integrase [Cyclobacteriaceae bacterium]
MNIHVSNFVSNKMIEKALPGLHLDTRRVRKDNTYPIKLRVYYGGKRKYYALNMNLTKHDFEKIVIGKRLSGELRDIKFDLDEYVVNASKVIDDLGLFTFERFEKLFFNASQNQKDLKYRFEMYIDQLRKEDRIGSALSYEVALKSITKFKRGLSLDDISIHFLKAYENWMLKRGNSISTVGIYTRCIRTLMNQAIDEGVFNRELYPFGRRRYVIPQPRNIKKALKIEEIEKIFNYVPENEGEALAKDYWIFSYLCNGMNMTDMAKLKNNDLSGDTIVFIRSKTTRTSRSHQKPIVVIVNRHVQDIIDRRRNWQKDPDFYLFPILFPGVTAQREKELIRQLIHTTNKWIGRIAKKCGVEKKVTTYTARHSFSTVLKRSGVSIEFISESLGHADLKTTENYLDSFEESVKREIYTNLVDF